MLARAQKQYPNVEFWECATRRLDAKAVFNGVCSFSSMVYLDPIDLLHSIYRLHRALKSGGTLFLYGSDLAPSWRSSPYRLDIKQWMWGSYYGIDEVVQILEEHGYFDVLLTLEFSSESEPPKNEPKPQENAPPEDVSRKTPDGPVEQPPVPEMPSAPPYTYVVIAKKRLK